MQIQNLKLISSIKRYSNFFFKKTTYITFLLYSISSSYSMTMFQWKNEEAVFYYSLADGAKGVLAFIIYFMYIAFDIGKRFKVFFITQFYYFFFF